MSEIIQQVKEHVVKDATDFYAEFKEECCLPTSTVKDQVKSVAFNFRSYIHIPYFPTMHSPGWLVRYIVGPHTPELLEDLVWDVCAGVTVGLTLIPQALSYAQLANLPPICGLYAAILPSIGYALVGSSMQLAVGPVALVSLLTAELVAKYVPDYATDTEAAMDTAAQAALSCGIILCIMSLLNLGHFINFISMPVMSGFTTAAACLIGLSQLKNAFGFSQKLPGVPQTGQPGYDYNYQIMNWFKKYFYERFTTYSSDSNYLTKGEQMGHRWVNPYAVKICFGLYIPMIISQTVKNYIPATPERKKAPWYRIFITVNSLLPFCAIIIGANIAWNLHHQDGYNQKDFHHSWYKSNLKVIGNVGSGLHFIRIPTLRWPMGEFLADCVPLTMIAYMESYSVARRIASNRNELHILSASQEMWGNGVANLLASIASAYPVSGSFSRSSLNYASGARTPVSKLITVCLVTLALGAMTKTMTYIPNAALSAVIWLAISNLIVISDYWECWIHNKKDFFTMMVTSLIVFCFDTATGLAAGLGCSAIMLLGEVVLGKRNGPWVSVSRKDNDGVEVVKLESDVNFLNSHRVKDFVAGLYIQPPPVPDPNSSINERLFYGVTNTMDRFLRPDVLAGVEEVPTAIAIDFSMARDIDITGLKVINEVLVEGRLKGVKFVIFNIFPELVARLKKFHIKNDASTKQVNLDKYLALSALEVLPPKATTAKAQSADGSSDHDNSDDVDVESGKAITPAGAGAGSGDDKYQLVNGEDGSGIELVEQTGGDVKSV